MEGEGDIENAVQDQFSFHVKEFKEAIENEETMSSIITSAMEALAFGLGFDRVLLLFSDSAETMLQGKMALGKPFPVDPHSFVCALELPEEERLVAATAFHERSVEIFGNPLFADGWPFAALAVGSSNCIGVVYADKLPPEDGTQAVALGDREQVGLNILADLLDKALALNS
jgi:hypothetical protein